MKQGPEKNFSGREGFRTQGSPALCVGELSACQRTYDLAPLIYEGGGRRPGGARIFAQQIF